MAVGPKLMRYILSLLFFFIAAPAFAQVTGCTAAQMADNGSFSISGSNLVASTSLSAARDYSVCVIDTMSGVTNSGVGWPLTVHVTVPGGPVVTVNGQPSGATVSPGATMTVTVAGGPGNTTDWLSICTTGTPSHNNCSGLGYQWIYLSCNQTAPGVGVTSASCSMTAPGAVGSYQLAFLAADQFTVIATAPFSVSSGGGGSAAISLNTTTPSPGGTVTVSFSGTPAPTQTASSWIGICSTGTPSNGNCDGAGYDWNYLNCSKTLPTSLVNSPASCALAVPNPAANGTYNYQVVWFPQ